MEADRHVIELVQGNAAARLSQWGLAGVVDGIRCASLLSGACPVLPVNAGQQALLLFFPVGFLRRLLDRSMNMDSRNAPSPSHPQVCC